MLEFTAKLGLLAGMLACRLDAGTAAKLAVCGANAGALEDMESMDAWLETMTNMSPKQRTLFISSYETALLYLPVDECIHELPLTLAEMTEPSLN